MENEKQDNPVQDKKKYKKYIPVKPDVKVADGQVVIFFTEKIDQITFSPELAIKMGRKLVSAATKAAQVKAIELRRKEREKLYKK